ncbi:MAG: hypothetical protein V9G19_09125 [Tetrasphaera sp.]
MPLVGRTSPSSIRRVVVFPAPLAEEAVDLPAVHGHGHAVDGEPLGIPLGQLGDVHDGVVHGHQPRGAGPSRSSPGERLPHTRFHVCRGRPDSYAVRSDGNSLKG